MILAGDIGGTKTRLAYFAMHGGAAALRKMQTFESRAHASLEEILTEFITNNPAEIKSACLGVPGPIRQGKAFMTNLSWQLSEEKLKTVVGSPYFRLVNDLVITTAAVPYLAESDLTVLHAGAGSLSARKNMPCVVLAPGTGLGQAFLSWDAGRSRVHPSEGGHIDFAARSESERKLAAYLSAKYGRVSYERVLSGPGLVNIYDYLKESKFAPEPPELRRRLQTSDAASVITSAALNLEFELCTKALDMFASILGAQSGNLALNVLAKGGVYLGGGIPPKIAKKLGDGTLLNAYFDKGRMSTIVAECPLYIIKDDKAALLGAAHLAHLSLS